MTTPGFFRTEVDPEYNFYINPKNVRYVQSEITRRLKFKFIEEIEVPYEDVKSMLIGFLICAVRFLTIGSTDSGLGEGIAHFILT